ncbi:MAG: hypothetical protein ACOX8V_06415 [Thermoleophilia bacterium]|jgi:hypothetical protein
MKMNMKSAEVLQGEMVLRGTKRLPSRRQGWSSRSAGVVVVLLCVVILFSVTGCGGEGNSRESSSTSSVNVSTASTHGRSTQSTNVRALDREIQAAFEEMASALAPLHVYAPSQLPADTHPADTWWPVLQVVEPGLYQGPDRPNPHMSQDPTEPSAEMILNTEDGWLLFLENFRGDLGDAEGEVVGSIAGNTAVRHRLDGGVLVQWSDAGRWYGVFGRGVPEETVVDVALGMGVFSPPARD